MYHSLIAIFFSSIHIHARCCRKKIIIHYVLSTLDMKGKKNTLKIQQIKSCLILERRSNFPVNMLVRRAKCETRQTAVIAVFFNLI